jgi:aspartyl-tRNA synthetase
MSFATGEDVIRTVEYLISDLTRSLSSEFWTVTKGEDRYLTPKGKLVRRLTPHSHWSLF